MEDHKFGDSREIVMKVQDPLEAWLDVELVKGLREMFQFVANEPEASRKLWKQKLDALR